MKNVKWTANELLDSLNRECNQDEINELYKALIAYSLGFTEISEEVDAILDNIIEEDYFGDDDICGIVHQEIVDRASEKLEAFMN